MNQKSDFLSVVGLLVMLFLAVIASGGVMSILWMWFLVPLGLPAISVAHAIGLSLLSSLLIGRGNVTKHEDMGVAIGTAIGTLIVTLGLGWLVHLFM